MIINIDQHSTFIIQKMQDIFLNVENYRINVLDEFEHNPYTMYLVYMNDNNPIGFVHYDVIYDRYEICDICVISTYRNHGIATQLLKSVVELGYANNINNITLEVRKDNIPAIKLYKKLGFSEVAIRKNYYSNIDGILMEKEMI